MIVCYFDRSLQEELFKDFIKLKIFISFFIPATLPKHFRKFYCDLAKEPILSQKIFEFEIGK
ncbi:MAG: hypothetical protein K0S74_1262 [Chlamydiales bacterium]|jgi:hypothetical protein|nr:hypothetical protein [Chlamydiales bacterium]